MLFRSISEMDKKELPGYYKVLNPQTHSEYKVVYRGKGNEWNYCSCMDFKTNQLGTCKHLEAVGLWLKEKHRLPCRSIPGQQISVPDEVAEFLEQDRLRQAAQQRSDKRHIDFVDIDFACSANLLDDTPSDPTFDQAFINLQLRDLRTAYQSLSDDDRKLLCLYYYHELSMEEIGKKYGVTKMAISKRLRKLHDRLRSLIEK